MLVLSKERGVFTEDKHRIPEATCSLSCAYSKLRYVDVVINGCPFTWHFSSNSSNTKDRVDHIFKHREESWNKTLDQWLNAVLSVCFNFSIDAKPKEKSGK